MLRRRHYLAWARISILIFLIGPCSSLEQCALEKGGGFCPDRSECCPLHTSDGSGCVPFSHHTDGPRSCCDDDGDLEYGTGCAGGFKCAQSTSQDGTRKQYYCEEEDELIDEESGKAYHARQPRYVLYATSGKKLGQMYGFPVKPGSLSNSENGNENIIAYQSSMGPIHLFDHKQAADIEALLVVIHGSGRNADDYLYTGIVSSKLQTTIDPEKVLIIAPRFLAEEDGDIIVPVYDESGKENVVLMEPMKWNVTYPIPHTWRYGANALPPSQQISSYDAVDAIVEHFSLNAGHGKKYENLRRIIVAGHSAGGQFTHRWALTSNSPLWGDEQEEKKADNTVLADFLVTQRRKLRKAADFSVLGGGKSDTPEIRVVVANPRSFCYLDGRRMVNGTLQLPSQNSIDECPNYNTWEWGLSDGGELIVPYRDRAIEKVNGDRKKLAYRYSNRGVVYISAQNDTQILRRNCEDDNFEGLFRRQRSEFYFSSLQEYFGRQVHERLVVEGVGHDHSLMFESPQGIEAMFG